MKWLRKILGLCVHHYEHVAIYDGITYFVYVSRCKHCGKLKNHHVC